MDQAAGTIRRRLAREEVPSACLELAKSSKMADLRLFEPFPGAVLATNASGDAPTSTRASGNVVRTRLYIQISRPEPSGSAIIAESQIGPVLHDLLARWTRHPVRDFGFARGVASGRQCECR